MVGRRIEIVADLDRVRVFSGGAVVRPRPRLGQRRPSVIPSMAAAAVLRRGRLEVLGAPAHVEVEQRALSDYDTLLGLDGPVA